MHDRTRAKGALGARGESAKVKVEIFGESYTIKGHDSTEHIKMLAGYVNRKMEQVHERNHRLSSTKIAVLAALNIADEFSKLQEDYDNLLKMIQAEEKVQK